MIRILLVMILLSLTTTSCVEENNTNELTSEMVTEDLIALNWMTAVKDFDYPIAEVEEVAERFEVPLNE